MKPTVPTIIADSWHAGAAWYNTWPSHFKEVECFQQQVEPILYKYGVDMVYTGHTHAYEVCSRPPNLQHVMGRLHKPAPPFKMGHRMMHPLPVRVALGDKQIWHLCGGLTIPSNLGSECQQREKLFWILELVPDLSSHSQCYSIMHLQRMALSNNAEA